MRKDTYSITWIHTKRNRMITLCMIIIYIQKCFFLTDIQEFISYPRTKGAFHFSEMAGQTGSFECEMSDFHKISAQIHHNSVWYTWIVYTDEGTDLVSQFWQLERALIQTLKHRQQNHQTRAGIFKLECALPCNYN